MNKQTRIKEYKEMCSKYTDKKLLKELASIRKYMQTHRQYLDWGNLNPNDFNNNDRFIVLRELIEERGLVEI